jgi:hypothetical protein
VATRKGHTLEQVVRKLSQVHRMLGEGNDVADVCRELGVAEQIYYRAPTSSMGRTPTTSSG